MSPLKPKPLHPAKDRALARRALDAEKGLKALANQLRSEINKRNVDLLSADQDAAVELPRRLIWDLLHGMDVMVNNIRGLKRPLTRRSLAGDAAASPFAREMLGE